MIIFNNAYVIVDEVLSSKVILVAMIKQINSFFQSKSIKIFTDKEFWASTADN